MRVMLSCPYSLSLFGGVQAQVLGLARALRSQGVDARIIAPCDGPPPEPGITTVGPEHARAEQRLGGTGRGGAGGCAAHDGSTADVRTRRRAPARAFLTGCQPCRARRHRDPGRRHLSFRARRTKPVVPDAALAAPAVAAPDHVGDRGLRSSRAPGRAHVRYRMRDRPERRGSRSVREGRHAPAIAARDLLRGPARAAQGCVRAAGCVRVSRSRRSTSGLRATVRSATSCARATGCRSSGSAASPTTRRPPVSGARPWRVSRRSTVSRSASCCSRRWRPAPRSSLSDIDGYRDVARHDREALLVKAGDEDELAAALRTVLDDEACRDAPHHGRAHPCRRVLDGTPRGTVHRDLRADARRPRRARPRLVSSEAQQADARGARRVGRSRDPRCGLRASAALPPPARVWVARPVATQRCTSTRSPSASSSSASPAPAILASIRKTAGSSPTGGRVRSSSSTPSTARVPPRPGSSRAVCRSASHRRRRTRGSAMCRSASSTS